MDARRDGGVCQAGGYGARFRRHPSPRSPGTGRAGGRDGGGGRAGGRDRRHL